MDQRKERNTPSRKPQRQIRHRRILRLAPIFSIVVSAILLLNALLIVQAASDGGIGDYFGMNATNTTTNFTEVALDEGDSDFGESAEPTAQSTVAPTMMPTLSPVTDVPTNAPTDVATTLSDHPAPLEKEECLPDRFDNTEMDVLDVNVNIKRLYPGQFVCSKPYSEQRYRFGMTLAGNLVWKDTSINQVIVLYENDEPEKRRLYFELTTDATMLLKQQGDDALVWEGPALHLNQRPMSHYPRCISNHDCPYLHMHSDGVMVLNWISGGWATRNFVRVYGFDEMADIDCGDTRAC